MRRLCYKIPLAWSGRSAKDFLRNQMGLSTRILIDQKQEKNGLLKNGDFCRVIDILNEGDVLTLTLPSEKPQCEAVKMTLDIVHEDEDYLAINKPAQMPIHPSPGHDGDSLLNGVAFYQQQKGEEYRVRPLYRLDKDTSGLVVLGKHRLSASCAVVDKVYFAVCEGLLSGSGRIDIPIGLKAGSKIQRECGRGQEAVTCWQALVQNDNHTLLAVKLETGRTHQIRAHMSYIGHPLAGDDMYGGSRELIERQALHCGLLTLSCKALSASLSLQADFPKDFTDSFPWLPEIQHYKEAFLCQPV